jgi:succinate-semialdehyde dehydrogenase/glutarate-semialdehyde dehydrogenase
VTSVTELVIPFESRGEIAYAAAFIERFGEEGKRVHGDTIPATSASS